MAFIVKDLMVSLLQERGRFGPDLGIGLGGGGGPGGCCASQQCTYCSVGCSLCSDCTRCTTSCTLGSGGFGLEEVINPADLVVLKQRLRLALAEVEAREGTLRRQMRPQTLEEAEALEEELTGALEELRRLKSEFRATSAGEREEQG